MTLAPFAEQIRPARATVVQTVSAIASDAVGVLLARIGQDYGAVRCNLLGPSLQLEATNAR